MENKLSYIKYIKKYKTINRIIFLKICFNVFIFLILPFILFQVLKYSLNLSGNPILTGIMLISYVPLYSYTNDKIEEIRLMKI